MKRWHFIAAFLFFIVLLAGGITLTAHRLQDLRGEMVTLRLLPEPVWKATERAVAAVRERQQRLAAFSFGERVEAVFKNSLQAMKRLIPLDRFTPVMDLCRSLFFRVRSGMLEIKEKVLSTFIKGH